MIPVVGDTLKFGNTYRLESAPTHLQELLSSSTKDYILLLNKSDLVSQSGKAYVQVGATTVEGTCVSLKEGCTEAVITQLQSMVDRQLLDESALKSGEFIVTRHRHRVLLE